MRGIGTAGHVDHGKSTLVQALTGIHPDRLKEEQEREMTIDLGFAWLRFPPGEGLPDAEEVGIVDVPGHRDFIENMLAGVGGIDAALLVIAADEGVMPQTVEHLAILDILQIQAGVVALTKVDLIQDPEWLDLIEEEMREALRGTVLENAPIVRVSGRTGAGVSDIVRALQENLAVRPPRKDLGRPRLPVDRVFTMPGFGTVVTGTLLDGQLKIGDEVVVLPINLRGRIRGLQSHRRKAEAVQPGGRTAVNISGVNVDQLQRGDVVAHPGDYSPTRRLDVQFTLLADVLQPVKHNAQVKLFLGAAEVMARVRLLGREVLSPGMTGWLQLELSHPIVAERGDRYILRRPSPGETLGGGMVVDPHPKGRHRRFSEGVISRLVALSQGSPAEVFDQAVQAAGAISLREAVLQAHIEPGLVEGLVEELLDAGAIIPLEDGRLDPDSDTLIASRKYWSELSMQVTGELNTYHRLHPLRRGMPKEELRSRLKVSSRILNAALRKMAGEGQLVDAGPFVFSPQHAIRFNPSQQKEVDHLLDRFADQPYAPPSVKECQSAVGEDVYAALVELGRLVPVSADVVFRREDYEYLVSEVHRMLADGGVTSVSQLRDEFSTSRRYVLAVLEHLDQIGLTVREGDFRRLRTSNK